jgi:hypothetical protein
MDDAITESYKRQLEEKMRQLLIAEQERKNASTLLIEDRAKQDIERIIKDVEDLERKISPNSVHQKIRAWEKHVHKVNYKKAQAKIEKVLNNFSDGSGAALFLIQESQRYCGNYYINHLRERLEQRGIIRHHPVEISPGNCATPENFIRNLGEKVNINISGSLVVDICQLVDTLYDSLGNSSIMFLEIHLDLVAPYDDFLKWLIEDFWCNLANRRIQAKEHNLGLKIVGVVKTNKKISKELSGIICCASQCISEDKFLVLGSEKWKKQEVYNWLRDFSCANKDRATLENIAHSIISTPKVFPDSANGQLLRILDKLAN